MAVNKKEILEVSGMTCASCEMRIERALKGIEGVSEVKASFGQGKVYVTYDAMKVDVKEIYNRIEKAGYTVGKKVADKSGSTLKVNQIVGIGIILLALYVFINNTIGFNFIPQINQSMSYGMLFVVGLLTSLHCMAMCGGINMSQCIQYQGARTSGKTSAIVPSFLYNAGRVVSYTIIGGIVGLLGSVVSFSGTAKGIVAIVAGLFMLIMGVNMLNIFPWLRRFNPRMPKIFGEKIVENKSNAGPFYIGLLNGLMPCGPLQAMQLYALGTGSLVAGAASMFFFSLGTVPLMFGFGAVTTLLGKKFTKNMMKVSAVLIIVLGIVMMGRGFSLSGVTVGFADSNPQKAISDGAGVAQIKDGVQEVTINLESGAYAPIVVQKGVPVRFNIKADSANLNGCNGGVIIPKYNIEKQLEVGDNIIEFTPTEEGKIPYSCWMGMIRSNIMVVADINNVSGGDIKDANQGVQTGGMPCCQ